jgi:membrane-associated phospholipid phosphatase
LNLALADAGITSWDTKYHYAMWRPIDAISLANLDQNAATQPVLDWVPLITTPPFPTYTSGHSTFSGAAAGVLTAIYGEAVEFSSPMDPVATLPEGQKERLVRGFASFQEAAEEAGMSRIYGGIHFNFDNTAGLEAGQSVGFFVAHGALQPLAD